MARFRGGGGHRGAGHHHPLTTAARLWFSDALEPVTWATAAKGLGV